LQGFHLIGAACMKKIIAVDFYDIIWKHDGLFTLADMDALFAKYAEHGVTGVLWRLSAGGNLLYHSRTAERFDRRAANSSDFISRKTIAVMEAYDPAEAAVADGKKYGIAVYFWLTLFDEAGYGSIPDFLSPFCEAHPEYSWRSRDGKSSYYGVLSYTYPEVVEYRLNQIREINAYGGDGIYLCNRSHSRSPPIREEMRRIEELGSEKSYEWCLTHGELIEAEYKRCRGEYGFDPIALESYHGDLNDAVAWQRHRGSYFTRFMEKARANTPGLLALGLRYGANLGPYIYGDHFFDWERFTDSTITDAVAYDLQPPNYDREEDFPEFYRPTRSQKWLWMSLSATGPEQLLEAYRESLDRWRPHMDGIILFEAFKMTENQPYWDFIKEW